MMNRRRFVAASSAVAAAAVLRRQALAQRPADVTLEIGPMQLEIAPGKNIPTIAYNGQVPGPLIRWPYAKPIVIDVNNRTPRPEIVHWHGQRIASAQDGAMEEGSEMIAPGGQQRYEFAPQPAGFRWYHTHTNAGHNLKIAAYTGQFGCFYVEPKENPGAYDQELFLTLHDWKGYMGGGGDASMDVLYDYATINGRMLGHDDPIRVRAGQRVLLHIVNASATSMHELALSGHRLTVVALDGNPVPVQASVPTICLAPAERVDALVEMNQPGIWIMGDISDAVRKAGLGIVIEYAGATGQPRWIPPGESAWDYRLFASANATTHEPDIRVPLRFESKFHGHGEFDYWTINGKSYPDTDPVRLNTGKRYRLVMINHSSDDHPVHLHRHTFEVTSLDGKPLSGLMKDVLVVKAKSSAEVDFVADNPGATLFHCHQQSHMDFGFMMLFAY
jgi:FtsP/CotA-like multicopper oxidase with cupredoxin domain